MQELTTEVFRTTRLTIRRFRSSDGPGLYAYLSRPEAVAFEPYPVQSLADCAAAAADRAQNPDFWAVCLRSGELIGNLYLHATEPADWRGYELGYVFHPDHWGRGYAAEAASALLDMTFTRWHAHRIEAYCNPANTASWRLLERLCFRREGHLRQHASFRTTADGTRIWQDTYLYALLAEDLPPR